MSTTRSYIYRGFSYLLWTILFGILTFWYWFISNGNMLMAYFWNVVGISFALLIEKRRINKIYKQLALCVNDEERAKLSKKDVTSVKTSLYLFYVLALIFSHVVAMDIWQSVEITRNVRAYSQVVGHGLILLFAIDTFMKHLVDDDKRVRKFQADCSCKNE